ncbi:MAG TPA: DUF3088 family protein [Desulfotignum sp.]|nr:DUF3088 family protein [Desulfotignum sp.]
MSKPVLYMLNTWFDAPGQGPFYCPDCGIVEGFFIYNPKIKEQVDIIHVDFQRPRPDIIEQLGEENQGSPVLVLPDDSVSFDGIKKSMTTGKAFIYDPLSICNYLALTYNGVLPHPQG